MLCTAFFAATSLLGRSTEEDPKTLVVKPVFTTTQNTVTDWGGSIGIVDLDPKYEMHKVEGINDLYKCTMKLKAYFKSNKWKSSLGEEYNPLSPNEGWNNSHQFVVVYQDNYGDQVNKNNPNAADGAQEFTIETDDTEVTFYAIINTDGTIRSYCDAQSPTITLQSNKDGNIKLPVSIGKTFTNAIINIDNDDKKKIEASANKHILNPDGNFGKYTVASRGKHAVGVDFHSISYSITKIVDNIESPKIQIGTAEATPVPTTTTNIGTFTANKPLSFIASINGVSTTTSPFNVENVEVDLYYEIIPVGELTGTEVRVSLKTAAQGEQTLATWKSDALNLSEGLADGNYILKFRYETRTLGNTIVDDNNGEKYTISFSAYNGLILKTLKVSEGTLTPQFTSNILDYTVNVEKDITTITLTATAPSKVEIFGHTGEQTLNYGANNFAITVSPEGIENVSETYNITVNRAKNTDATLSALTVSNGLLDPTFTPDTQEYALDVANEIATINITATTNDANATVAGIGEKTLNAGENIFKIIVTAQDGITTKTYTVIVNRAKSTDATLSILTVSEGILNPAFTAETFQYAISIDSDITTINITAITSHGYASVIGSGEHSVNVGENIFNIIVTAQDETTTQTYTIVVDRDEPSGINQINSNLKIKVENRIIYATFDKETSISLYNTSGLLLDKTNTVNYSKVVNEGLYLLLINRKSYKILVK